MVIISLMSMQGSVLIDKYHTYKPDGIKKVWAKGDIWWCWVKNNIPWVEEKLMME